MFECADGAHVTLGAIEPQFYAELMQRLELDDVDPRSQYDSGDWPALKPRIAALIRSRDRDHWCAQLLGTDACFAPVLDLEEAAAHPHNQARQVFREVDGKIQPAPAPRFSRTPARESQAGPLMGEQTDTLLASLGYDADALRALRAERACA